MAKVRKSGIEAALVSKDGVDYALVIVRPDVLDDPQRADFALDVLGNMWPNHTVVLVSSTSTGVRVLAEEPETEKVVRPKASRSLNWQRYSLA